MGISAPRTVIGLMAGTSLDGIDATLVKSDGRTLERLGVGGTFAYRDRTLEAIESAIAAGRAVLDDASLRRDADALVADDHAAAVGRLLDGAGVAAGEVSLAGFHGQTVHHAPELGRSVQLGDPARLARAIGIDVVARFREADLAAGGEGAPLAPVYQAAMLDALGATPGTLMLNLGGVANLGGRFAVVDREGDAHRRDGDGNVPFGFDCGPGNALLDACARERLGKAFDTGGRVARSGAADRSIVDALLADPFFARAPPKSLDRDRFVAHPALDGLPALTVADALATLVAISAAAVHAGLRMLDIEPTRLVVTGGGQHNRALLDAIALETGLAVDTGDALGLGGDLVEAELMALLAVRSVEGLPLTWPTTTGVAAPTTGGVLSRATRR